MGRIKLKRRKIKSGFRQKQELRSKNANDDLKMRKKINLKNSNTSKQKLKPRRNVCDVLKLSQELKLKKKNNKKGSMQKQELRLKKNVEEEFKLRKKRNLKKQNLVDKLLKLRKKRKGKKRQKQELESKKNGNRFKQKQE